MEWFIYSLLFAVALLMSATAVYAFWWASKHGELRDLDAQAESIFDDYEPRGVQTDYFPGKDPRRSTGSAKQLVSEQS